MSLQTPIVQASYNISKQIFTIRVVAGNSGNTHEHLTRIEIYVKNALTSELVRAGVSFHNTLVGTIVPVGGDFQESVFNWLFEISLATVTNVAAYHWPSSSWVLTGNKIIQDVAIPESNLQFLVKTFNISDQSNDWLDGGFVNVPYPLVDDSLSVPLTCSVLSNYYDTTKRQCTVIVQHPVTATSVTITGLTQSWSKKSDPADSLNNRNLTFVVPVGDFSGSGVFQALGTNTIGDGPNTDVTIDFPTVNIDPVAGEPPPKPVVVVTYNGFKNRLICFTQLQDNTDSYTFQVHDPNGDSVTIFNEVDGLLGRFKENNPLKGTWLVGVTAVNAFGSTPSDVHSINVPSRPIPVLSVIADYYNATPRLILVCAPLANAVSYKFYMYVDSGGRFPANYPNGSTILPTLIGTTSNGICFLNNPLGGVYYKFYCQVVFYSGDLSQNSNNVTYFWSPPTDWTGILTVAAITAGSVTLDRFAAKQIAANEAANTSVPWNTRARQYYNGIGPYGLPMYIRQGPPVPPLQPKQKGYTSLGPTGGNVQVGPGPMTQATVVPPLPPP